MTQYVYPFGPGLPSPTNLVGDKLKKLLGGKGAGLVEMNRLDLPVPPGLTISTEICAHYHAHDRHYPDELREQIAAALAQLETVTERKFGDTASLPLLVSVRSGARTSMPGMMDTILNVGLNDHTVYTLATATGHWGFAFDCYRRLIEMYGVVVMGIPHSEFAYVLDQVKDAHGYTQDSQLSAENWQAVISGYKHVCHRATREEFPQDPHTQLWGAIGAVFQSWNNDRARTYRSLNNIPDDWGTAVTVQAMVFGNASEDSATGVVFTRNPSTGEKSLFGEFLQNAQGEDVVAGIRTPRPIAELKRIMPDTYDELVKHLATLEAHFRDMQDVEFTVENGTLYILQTRNGKRSARSAVKIAVDLVLKENAIDVDTALVRVDPASLAHLFHPVIADKTATPWTNGLPASPGAVSGALAFTADEAKKRAAEGEDVILVRKETCPDDIDGMHAAVGILTARGGMTSHAAVVARGMGKPCVTGAKGLVVDAQKRTVTIDGVTLGNDAIITIDGHTGAVYADVVHTEVPKLPREYDTLMRWADGIRRLRVRANAETPEDASKACKLGADGIGLARTEHMFFDDERIPHMVAMIMAKTAEERRAALEHLLPFQRDDFTQLFTIMEGLPVTIRLLDPPLHEFLPKSDEEFGKIAAATGHSTDELRARARELHETHPMLGLRGVRLAVLYPEIVEMQARAIFEAAYATEFSTNPERPLLEIMVPLVIKPKEFEIVANIIRRTAAKAGEAYHGRTAAYRIGTMIETPAAAQPWTLIELVKSGAEFFSLGTNDLTQTTLALSRDDAGTFLPPYIEAGIFSSDPFATIDPDVGMVVRHVSTTAFELGQKIEHTIKVGVCGEHGGDPKSIELFHEAGLDYVSCSPFRVPVARLAAAQVVARYNLVQKGRRATVTFS